MSVLYVLMPLALLVVAGFVGAFVWAVRSGQLDDTETPPLRVLAESPPERPKNNPPASS